MRTSLHSTAVRPWGIVPPIHEPDHNTDQTRGLFARLMGITVVFCLLYIPFNNVIIFLLVSLFSGKRSQAHLSSFPWCTLKQVAGVLRAHSPLVGKVSFQACFSLSLLPSLQWIRWMTHCQRCSCGSQDVKGTVNLGRVRPQGPHTTLCSVVGHVVIVAFVC